MRCRFSNSVGLALVSGWLLLVSGGCGDSDPLPPPMSVEFVVDDLIARFDDGEGLRIVHQNLDRPLASYPATFEKGLRLASDQARKVIVAPAESAFEVEVGPYGQEAKLHVRTLVYTVFRMDKDRADPAPVIFRVLVNGEERLALSSDYINEPGHEHPFDQLMRTSVIDLQDFAGVPLTIRFETTRPGPPVPEGVSIPEYIWWDLSVTNTVAIPRQHSGEAAPNILVLCVDTLGARHTSLYGYGRDTTPHLVGLAEEGLLVQRAIAPSSWTLPSTATLFTGLPPNTHGVLGDQRSYLMEGLWTWPERLRQEGIEGGAFVANPLVVQANNFDQGFGTWVHQRDADAEDLNQSLLEWVDEQPTGGRWFAYVHYMDPHAPYGAPGPEGERFTDTGFTTQRDLKSLLPYQLQQGEVPPLEEQEKQRITDLYDGEVAYFDRAVGDLFEGLQSRGLDDETVVVVTADHGEELFDHGHLGHGYTLHEEMVHVPLVLAGPGIPQGVVIKTPVPVASLFNTILSLAGLPLDDQGPPPLFPIEDWERREEPVFSAVRTHLFGPSRILVSALHGDYKVICELKQDGELEEALAFDLSSDPLEKNPVIWSGLSFEDRQEFERLKIAALEWHAATAAARPVEPQPRNPDIEEALREVGYIGGEQQ
ncbi:MAG: sulfatase-like hydrolase/transferase [Planctomycetota bacterium]|nr:sulfatase-like hydrolase/transferase [Planctomycetota bacterium]